MNQDSIPFVDRALARQIEACHAGRAVRYAQAQARLQPASHSEVLAVAGGYAVYAGSHSPLNKASGLGFTGAITADMLDRVEQFYQQRSARTRVELCPLTDPTLLELMGQRGYRLESFLNVLVRDVPTEPLPVALPPQAVIEQALPHQAGVWIHTTTQGFEGVDAPSERGLTIQAPTFHSADTYCYLAWIDAEPAAGAAMVVHAEMAEFGGTSTRPLFRKRGLQTALVHTRLNAARALGCAFAITLTTPGSVSQRNLERAGFRLAYTTVLMGKA